MPAHRPRGPPVSSNATATAELYTLSLHDALPICRRIRRFDRKWRAADDRRRGRRCDLSADRKSTRLNSSHEWISYAVFCLKKKKFHIDQAPLATVPECLLNMPSALVTCSTSGVPF